MRKQVIEIFIALPEARANALAYSRAYVSMQRSSKKCRTTNSITYFPRNIIAHSSSPPEMI